VRQEKDKVCQILVRAILFKFGELRKQHIRDVYWQAIWLANQPHIPDQQGLKSTECFHVTFYSSSPTTGGEGELVLLPILRHPER
jgi:hypothetical protein